MDILRAKEILEILADGVNPMTGEVLPPEDACNQADVIRALHAALGAIPATKTRVQPMNAGKPWTPEEENRVVIEYDSGKSTSAIAKEHGRSRGAIESRLVALGRLESTYFPRSVKK